MGCLERYTALSLREFTAIAPNCFQCACFHLSTGEVTGEAEGQGRCRGPDMPLGAMKLIGIADLAGCLDAVEQRLG